MFRTTIWYTVHTLKNSIKRMWKVVFFIIIFVVGFIILMNVADKDKAKENVESHSQVESMTPEEYQKTLAIGQLAIHDTEDGLYLFEHDTYNKINSVIINGIIGMVIMLFISLGLMSGAKNGANIFMMPDVNFLFPSPNKPQAVLLFRMIGQLGVALIGAIYIFGQLPNLMHNGGLKVPGVIIFFIAYVLLQLVMKVIGLISYILLQKRPKLRDFVSKYALILMLLPAGVAAILYATNGQYIFNAANAVFCSKAAYCIPFWGWLLGSTACAFSGEYLLSIFFLLLTALGTIALAYASWKIPCDFYEDALTNALAMREAQEQAQNVAAGGMRSNVSHDKGRGKRVWDKRRNKELTFDNYEGAKVFFAKTMLGRKRMFPLGGLWSSTCSTYFWLGAGFLGITLISNNVAPSVSVLVITCILGVTMFMRSFMNPLQIDLAHNFIYLIPERPSAVLGWGMAGQMLDGALDLLPVTLLTAIITAQPVMAICMFLLLLSMHLFFGMTALMINLVIKGYLPVYLSNALQSIIRMIPFVPVVLIYVFGFKIDNPVLPTVLAVLINIAVSLLVFIPCPYHLHKGKR
ncbi:MAG: putative ABC exporter domain-containing protein [Lachnospiraceae bacterium]|nr:putative ABC exporter domain-containing protein [Lachnospiraceae bacterium]